MRAQVQRPATPTRQPRPHERVWEGRRVDKNLDDAWLEALNALTALNLISICEGHRTAQRSSEPHINLRIKADRQTRAVSNWKALQTAVDEFLLRHAVQLHDTLAEAELKRRSRTTPSRGHSRENDFVIRLRRVSTSSEPMNCWFDRIVPFVQSFDLVVAAHTKASS